MAIDMFLDLPEIPGESQKDGHEGQWDLLSYSEGVVQQGSFDIGGKGGGSGKAEFQDISLVKYVDKASPMVFQACAAGTHFSKATIYVRKAGEKPLEYLKVELNDLIVSSVQNSGAASGDSPMESITMNCAKITKTYVEQDATGGAGKTVTAGYDIRVGEKV
jgi:type VI secretion system secreted protein Hcp